MEFQNLLINHIFIDYQDKVIQFSVLKKLYIDLNKFSILR